MVEYLHRWEEPGHAQWWGTLTRCPWEASCFFSILLATLTDKNDVIMDWQCGVGTPSFSISSLLWIFRYFCFTCFRTNNLPLFALGGSITACRSLERHIVALESDPVIFNALLLPMRDSQPARISRSVAAPSTSIFDPPQKMTKRAFGFLCT
jgi:hypothetical protein